MAVQLGMVLRYFLPTKTTHDLKTAAIPIEWVDIRVY